MKTLFNECFLNSTETTLNLKTDNNDSIVTTLKSIIKTTTKTTNEFKTDTTNATTNETTTQNTKANNGFDPTLVLIVILVTIIIVLIIFIICGLIYINKKQRKVMSIPQTTTSTTEMTILSSGDIKPNVLTFFKKIWNQFQCKPLNQRL